MLKKFITYIRNERGMEMVQVAILIGIAIGIGVLFKSQIGNFINGIFDALVNSDYTSM
ncbi:MAG: hypothetical protein GX285_10430 [Clostridiales bacterium]|nr:hypothetical protein [Clostridiales bacterium]